MLFLYFKDFFIILPFFLYFVFFWIFFIKNNFYNVRINPSSTDILKNSKFLKKVHYIFMVNWSSINFIYLISFLFFLKADFNVFWFNHLKFNNFNFSLIILIIFFALILINLIKLVKNSNINYNLDYFSSIINLTIFVPILFLSNTIFTFLFLLELTSLIILYKFSVSKVWFDNNKNFNKNSFGRLLPKSYLNMIFFQYWANFFSSMLLMFSIFNIIYMFGSSDWFFINTLNNVNTNIFYFNNNIIFTYIYLSFLIGFFLKIGFTPLHLFKIEVYKGIPFISIFFYTSWYFLSFFLYFLIIIYNNLYNLKIYFNLIIYIFLLIGLFYSISLLFDVNLVKSFFAYSTIVNVLNFLIVLYLILN